MTEQRMLLQQQITEYIRTELIGDSSVQIGPDTPLVSSGLVDSFDLVELLGEVERIAGRKLPAHRIGPQDMESVNQILDLFERF